MAKSQQVKESTTASTQNLLLNFLSDNDAACPVCGYNLRALTRPICPECQQQLKLTVGTTRLRLGLLFAALAPGFFSGVAACFVLNPTVAIFYEDGTLIPQLVAVVLFGWLSGLFAIILAVKRNRFIAQLLTRQRWFALTIWFIHFAALVLFIFSLDPLI